MEIGLIPFVAFHLSQPSWHLSNSNISPAMSPDVFVPHSSGTFRRWQWKQLTVPAQNRAHHRALRERVPNIYPEKNMNQKDTCTTMFTAASFTTAKTWKQPKCPSTEEWIKNMWYIHAMEYHSAIKKNETMLFEATWTELESVILSEVSQTEKEKYCMTSLICGF